MSISGCLFDLIKLNDVSKNVISVMSAAQVYENVAAWSAEFDAGFNKIFTADPAFSTAVLNIDREGPKPRKDIAKWSEVKAFISYFYNELYTADVKFDEKLSADDIKAILTTYLKVYDPADDKDTWFAKIKEMCEPLGFTPNVKEYKKNPEAYKGHVGDVSGVIRMAVTSRSNTPDLCAIMQLLGKDEVTARINNAISTL